MKTKQWVAVPAAVLATCAVASLPCAAQGNSGNSNGNNQSVFPAMPSGWLTAFPTIVQTGTHPTISWGINYPSIVEDYVTISGSCIWADEEVDIEVRVLGAGVTVTTNSSGGFSFVPTEANLSYNGGTYTRIFYGTNLQVNPNTVVYSRKLEKNRRLCFGGKYFYNNKWGPTYNSTHVDNVRTLVNGSTPPGNVPDYGAPSLEEFIKPYLTPDNKVKIGPMDVIVFMELTHTSSQITDPGFDLQDMVLLVTVKSKAKTNNGHGNNIDGIDSSNPGNAPFINLDTDPEIDDEGGGGGAAPSDP